MTKSGNGNNVGVYIKGGGNNTVNVSVVWDAKGSQLFNSLGDNVVRAISRRTGL